MSTRMEQVIKSNRMSNRSPLTKHKYKLARKLAFSKFVKSCEVSANSSTDRENGCLAWLCCSDGFNVPRDFHRHVALHHAEAISADTETILTSGCKEARWQMLQEKSRSLNDPEFDIGCGDSNKGVEMELPCVFNCADRFPWLPDTDLEQAAGETGQILLFYKYRQIRNTEHVKCWQNELCRRLNLTGKIRIATEGINATVGGPLKSTNLYIEAMMNHPLFCDMTDWDFKMSEGEATVFPDGLKVGVYQEIVPMGIHPDTVSYRSTGEHLSADEFHEVMESYIRNDNPDKVFIDCRNFYESKIGKFEGAVCPDIRKFSYWPEYVDKNKALFENKQVYMYCTGGIRCERGSAYLLSKGICNGVYQLKGGIHKYIEKFPDGHFRGKLFVFDDRYHIQSNSDILSNCHYCDKPWDQYKPCTSCHCHQLVLSCPSCRESAHTACCDLCQAQSEREMGAVKEECECTRNRQRIPVEEVPVTAKD